MSAVDKGTIRDRRSLNGTVGVNIRVGVRVRHTKARNDIIAIRPRNKEHATNHTASERNTTPALLLTRKHHLRNKILSQSLRDGNTKTVAIVDEALEVDARLGIGVGGGSKALGGGET